MIFSHITNKINDEYCCYTISMLSAEPSTADTEDAVSVELSDGASSVLSTIEVETFFNIVCDIKKLLSLHRKQHKFINQ